MEILAILGALEELEVELANLYEWLSEVLADQHQDAIAQGRKHECPKVSGTGGWIRATRGLN